MMSIDAQFAAAYADFAVCGPRLARFAAVVAAAESMISIEFACLLDMPFLVFSDVNCIVEVDIRR